jgi:hypothetical protein
MKTLAFTLAALLPLAALAQPQPLPAAPPRAPAMNAPAGHGYLARLEKMLRDSRDQRRRVVVLVDYQEIAGVVLDLGPDWVILSNQKDQEILLQTHKIERAEFR